jgi:hypothetical protein
MILIAAVDVPFQLYDHSKKLKMTLQEVKDEMKTIWLITETRWIFAILFWWSSPMVTGGPL